MKSNKLLKYHLPVILYGVLVISLSSIAHFRAPKFKHFELDKIAHFFEYGIFAFLVFRSFSHISNRLRLTTAFLLSLLFLTFFGYADEFYQQYVPGRDPNLWDFLADMFGAILMLILLWWRRRQIDGSATQ